VGACGDQAGTVGLCGVQWLGGIEGSADGTSTGSGDRWPSDGAGVAQVPLALSRSRLRDEVVDRAGGRDRPPAVLTDRAKREIARQVGQDASAVSTVANAFGVSWTPAIWQSRGHCAELALPMDTRQAIGALPP
jgi:hypothetical protein